MKKQEPLHQQNQAKESQEAISRLQNSIYYFLDCVFIIISEGNYRLVILHHDNVIMDNHYPTLRGAKIAFAKFFNEMAWAQDVKPQWSHYYEPEKDWLEKKLEILNKSKTMKMAHELHE